jgi:hypothetical protein
VAGPHSYLYLILTKLSVIDLLMHVHKPDPPPPPPYGVCGNVYPQQHRSAARCSASESVNQFIQGEASFKQAILRAYTLHIMHAHQQHYRHVPAPTSQSNSSTTA